ncbi:arginase family protein, partial [Sinorhizobium meliloti]|uniref:arginase family protein n=1 Tax=Rhizobium meliloti TaxID=382 RepID=UPI001F191B18
MKTITLIGAPIEEGSGRRGAAMGPTALRIAGIDTVLAELGHTVNDEGDLRPLPARDLANHPGANNLQSVAAFARGQRPQIPLVIDRMAEFGEDRV